LAIYRRVTHGTGASNTAQECPPPKVVPATELHQSADKSSIP
jgi:hypothetical protein